MAKVNKDGTIDGDMKVVDEDVNKKDGESSETPQEDEKKSPSKVKKGLAIAGGVLVQTAVIALSVFAGTKLKK